MPSLGINPQVSSDGRLRFSANTSITLLHDGAVPYHIYKVVIPLLTLYFHGVYAPDLVGHGDSASLGAFTFSKSTALLLEAIEDLKSVTETRICLVGVSLGGQAVLDVLQHDKAGLVDSAIVASATISPSDEVAKFEIPTCRKRVNGWTLLWKT